MRQINHPIDIAVKMLYFAGETIREHGNLSRIPGRLTESLGINGCAVGIVSAQHCKIYLNSQDNNSETGTTGINADVLRCREQDSSWENTVPCRDPGCPARQNVVEKRGRQDQETVCFPMTGGKGFLMAWGDGTLLNSFPVKEMLKAAAHLIECSLDPARNDRKAASYFLPTEDMAQMWSEMLAGLSHDLRTPLACIKGYVTTLLREDVTWDQDAQKEFLNIIVEETDHIESLINNLLDSSTLSWKGEIELKKEPVSLPKIVNKVLKNPSYRRKNHQYVISFPEDFPSVEVDPVRIEQVISNLVDNAVKYSAENTQIAISGNLSDDEVIITVADQGIGISDEHLNRLFEKFFRVSNGIREHEKGMGLGLPLARQILKSHGGRIWAKSKLNHGTTFYFTLPAGPRATKNNRAQREDQET